MQEESPDLSGEFQLVWTHSRYDRAEFNPLNQASQSPYDIGTLDQISDTFGLFPQNIFLIKLNYLFLQ